MRRAVIIPFRDRHTHLSAIAPVIKSIIPDADIFVIEQGNDLMWNKGILFNAAASLCDHDYFILHDVDMVPQSDVDYSAPNSPTLLATKCSQFDYKMPSASYFGGVVLISRKDFMDVGGFSNRFWGWGGEDDEFKNVILRSGKKIEKRECVFESFAHKKNYDPNTYKKNVDVLRGGRVAGDGVDFVKFNVKSTKETDLYKFISITFDASDYC